MELQGKVAVVTGGAQGIGRALCRRFAVEGANIVVADLDADGAAQVAQEIGGLAVPTDVADESQIRQLVARATEQFGRVDLFCCNAGVYVGGGIEVPDEDWKRIWDVNVQSHLYAARAVLPQMLERGEGYLLTVVSAAGLLTQIGSAPYSVTKHAALALAEWLAITYGDQGIKVSCLCPQGVRTQLLLDHAKETMGFLRASAISAEQAAHAVVEGLQQERFLILPHPEVADYFQRKATDYDRWLSGMRRLQQKVKEEKQASGSGE